MQLHNPSDEGGCSRSRRRTGCTTSLRTMLLVNDCHSTDCESFDRCSVSITLRIMREVIYNDGFCTDTDCNEKERERETHTGGKKDCLRPTAI